MIGVGYGDSQLKAITAESVASDPKGKHTFTFGYDQLIETAPKVIKSACEGRYSYNFSCLCLFYYTTAFVF